MAIGAGGIVTLLKWLLGVAGLTGVAGYGYDVLRGRGEETRAGAAKEMARFGQGGQMESLGLLTKHLGGIEEKRMGLLKEMQAKETETSLQRALMEITAAQALSGQEQRGETERTALAGATALGQGEYTDLGSLIGFIRG